MGKDSATPPDYKANAEATAQGNIQQLAYQTNANRPNTVTPWGSQTWANKPSFDQAGWDTAVQKYQAANPQGTYTPEVAGHYEQSGQGEGGAQVYVDAKPGYWSGASSDPLNPAPDRNQFMKDNWSSTISLTPDEQKALDSQQRVQVGRSTAAEGLLQQATDAFGRPVDYNSMPKAGQSVDQNMGRSGFNFGNIDGTPSDYRQKAQDAVDKLQQPSLDRARAAAETRLANQGITKGSEAYATEMQGVSDNEARAHLAAISEGRNEDAMKFGQDLSTANFDNQRQGQDTSQISQRFQQAMAGGDYNTRTRMAAIAEELQRRGMTLNELNALLTGQQVQMPTQPGQPTSTAGRVAGADYSGAASSQYDAALGQANANNATTNSALGSAASLAGMALMFSDVRLKEDIVEVGLLASGLRVVHYRYRGRPRRYTGVIAQEVARVIPEAVVLHPSGFLMVDYSKVH